jgi:hypothetical protein
MQFRPLENTDPSPVTEITSLTTVAIPVVPVSSVDDTDDLNNPELIWCKTVFPCRTKPYQFTPSKLYTTLLTYADTVTPFTELLCAAGIEYDTFCSLSDRYTEIAALYAKVRARRAVKWGEIAEKTHAELPTDLRLYQTDEAGNKVLTTAAAAFLKNKAAIAHRCAAICETGSYIATSKQETINRNLTMSVTMQGKLPEGFDLATADTSMLIDAIKGRGKR